MAIPADAREAIAADRVANSDRAIDLSPAEHRARRLKQLWELSQDNRDTGAIAPGSAIATRQAQAAARIPELAIPSSRDESWRFTDLSSLMTASFISSQAPEALLQQPLQQPPDLSTEQIAPWILPEAQSQRLVFVDGSYCAALSSVAGLPGLTVSNLRSNPDACTTAEQYLAQLPGAEAVFTTLNTATFADVAVVHLQPNCQLEAPVHLLFIASDSNRIVQPRCLIVAEAQSQMTLIEDYVALGEGAGLCNAVTEVVIAANAQLHHSRLQRGSHNAFHLGKTTIVQAPDSRYTQVAVHMGAGLSRHTLEAHHQGSQVETNLYGLALVAGNQLADTHSNIQYNYPHCSSDQLYKAIATDQGRSVFSGRIGVPKAAQQTNAAQLNRNLLLSNRARIDTKPQLEIVADDVKCSHGATVSQLEDDQIFYLQSRGIDRTSAQHLLIEAFAAEILLKLPVASLRQALGAIVAERTERL